MLWNVHGLNWFSDQQILFKEKSEYGTNAHKKVLLIEKSYEQGQ